MAVLKNSGGILLAEPSAMEDASDVQFSQFQRVDELLV